MICFDQRRRKNASLDPKRKTKLLFDNKTWKKKFLKKNILIYSAEIEMALRKLASTLLAMDVCNSKQLFKVSKELVN